MHAKDTSTDSNSDSTMGRLAIIEEDGPAATAQPPPPPTATSQESASARKPGNNNSDESGFYDDRGSGSRVGSDSTDSIEILYDKNEVENNNKKKLFEKASSSSAAAASASTSLKGKPQHKRHSHIFDSKGSPFSWFRNSG